MPSHIDCANAPNSTHTDAGIAGAGVLLAFIITAGLVLILATYIMFAELRPRPGTAAPRTISRKLLSSFSDQQIIEGIGIQIVGLAKLNTIVPYHFFIVWMLALLSTTSHLATLIALVNDYKRDWILRWGRQFFMFINLALNIVYGVFVLETNWRNLEPTLPMVCAWADHAETKEPQGNRALSTVGTIAVIVASLALFVLATWYLHMRKQRWNGVVRVVGTVALAALGIGATVRVIIASQAFGSPSVNLADQGEKTWSFGQLLGMLMLILPLISALELLRGELRVPQTKCDDKDERQSLTENESQMKPMGSRYTYQQNPWDN